MMKILIIDDEEIIREIIANSIDWNELDYEVVGFAADGKNGFQKIEELKPDIVLVDIRMPGLDGIELLSMIHDNNFDCKVIILSGHREFEYAQEALRLGAFRYLVKPASPEELVSAVNDAASVLKKERAFRTEFNNLEQQVAQFDKMDKRNQQKASVGGRKNYSRLVTLALDYINNNYSSKEMGLKSVSNEVFVSTWYLSKLIKRETGENFIKILTRVRLEHAKELLGNPQYKVYEVASMVGFDDVPHFTKTFKSVVGMSPLEFRRDFISNRLNSNQDPKV